MGHKYKASNFFNVSTSLLSYFTLFILQYMLKTHELKLKDQNVLIS
jgi:hypothetical protein